MRGPEYKATLADIIQSTGRHVLTCADVKRYTGIADSRTVKSRFPFKNGLITAAALALALTKGEDNGNVDM